MKARLFGALGAALALTLGPLGSLPASADEIVRIPDAALHACLATALADAGLPPDLVATNLAKVEDLICRSTDYGVIHDLAGIDKLTGVLALNLNGNSGITDLKPLASLARLRVLDLESSDLTDASPLASLTGLQGLNLTAAKLHNLDFVQMMTALEWVSLRANPNTSLAPVWSRTQLKSLAIQVDASSDLSGLARLTSLASLDLYTDASHLPSMLLPSTTTSLSLWSTGPLASVANLPVAPQLTDLWIWMAHGLRNLHGVEGLTGLTTLTVQDSPISDLAALKGLTGLRKLEVYGGAVSDLTPIAGLTSLKTLGISTNHISDLNPLRRLAALTSLWADSNQITSLEALRGLRLTSLEASSNQISDASPVTNMTTLERLWLDDNQLRDLSAFAGWKTSIRATNQTIVQGTKAVVGVPVAFGIRNQAGQPLCPLTTAAGVNCTAGQLTYSAAGPYSLSFADADPGGSLRFSGRFSQNVAPGTPFPATYSPKVAGVPEVGRTVRAQSKFWTPKVTAYTYQWYRDGKRITGPGSDGYSYTPVAKDRGHRLNVCVTGHRATYQAKRLCSGRSGKVDYGKLRAPKPKVSGEDVTDSTLTAVRGTWTAGTTLRYQWQRNHKNIRGATAASFRLRSGDVGDHIRVRITGSQSGYHSSTRYSSSITQRRAAFTAKVPTITGTAAAGQVLTVQAGAWSPEPTHLSYRWYRNGTSIKGATATTYALTVADIGKQVTVKVTGTKAGYGSKSVFSRATAPVVA